MGRVTCHLVAVLHAFRCPTGGGHYVFVRPFVRAGVLALRVVGLTA